MSPALVGREDELWLLDLALEDVGGGSSRIVVLLGEPGIGKSRLLDEARVRALERGLLVASGRASELERDLTFGLLLDAFHPLLSGQAASAVEALEGEQQRELAGARHVWGLGHERQ